MGTTEEDEKECADELTTKKPTAECCEDTKKVKASKPKCLCILIKESSDPSMGLPVNTTLALQIPSACNIDAKVSDCPSILKLPPNSPDAKIFTEAGADSPTTASSSSASPAGSASTSYASGSSSEMKATPSSSGVASFKLLDSTSLLGLMALMTWIFV
ncbi:hypothetical protein L6164_011334 [Bauhinia variegata]|uniref:Uncharacterized protein n=1 Tax=Bauhinia variegata TaxID=167791 RepID=A0ACB9PAR7_BAUVA|nr:hypothetical protein L6164_011334 [Bauhinia variegata]